MSDREKLWNGGAFVVVLVIVLITMAVSGVFSSAPSTSGATPADPRATACGSVAQDDVLKAACETSYDDCQLEGAAKLADRYVVPDPSDTDSIVIDYAKDDYDGSGWEIQAASRIGCRSGLENP